MMEATLSWSWGVGTNRPVGRGLWTWLDLADPDDGPVVLAGAATRGYWPFPAEHTRRVDDPAELLHALHAQPALIALDESFLGPETVIRALADAAEGGATIMIDRRPGGPMTGPGAIMRRIAGRPARPRSSATDGSRGLRRLADSLGSSTPMGCLVPVVDQATPDEPAATSPGAGHGPSILMLPDTSGQRGPTLQRWRPEATTQGLRAPLVILARPWPSLPPAAALLGPSQHGSSVAPEAGWAYGPPRGYATQKSVLFVTGADDLVIKQSRDELGSQRLGAEIGALRHVHTLLAAAPPDDRRVVVPRVLAEQRRPGRTLVAESRLSGPSLLDVLAADGRAADADPLVDFLIDLGRASAGATVAAARSAAFGAVAERFAETFPLHRRTQGRVRAAAGRIAHVGIPSVQFHGDYTPWNVVRTETAWAVHDWENADPAGPPLWDLVLLMIGVVNAVEGPLAPRELVHRLTTPGPIHRLMTDWTGRYCREVGVDPGLVPDMWLTALAHQAVKESSRSRWARRLRGRSLRVLVTLRNPADLPGGRRG